MSQNVLGHCWSRVDGFAHDFVSRVWPQGRSDGRRLVRRVGILQAAAIVLNGTAQILAARVLGPSGKGLLTLLILIPSVSVMVASLGLDSAAAYSSAKRHASRSVRLGFLLASSAACATLALVLAGAAAIWVFGDTLSAVSPTVLFGALGLALPLTFVGFAGMYEMGARRVYAAPVSRLVIGAGFLGGSVAASFLASSADSRLAVVLGGYVTGVAAAAVGLWGYSFSRCQLSWPRRSDIMPAVNFGLRAYPGNLAQYLNLRLDQWIVGASLSSEALGVYSMAVAGAEVLKVAGSAVSQVAYSSAAKKMGHERRELARKATSMTLGISLLGGIALATLSPLLIPLVLGQGFEGVVRPLLFLLPGIIAVNVGTVVGGQAAAWGHPEAWTVAAVVAVIFTVVLDYFLIPVCGVSGAAVASSISYCAALVVVLSIGARVAR